MPRANAPRLRAARSCKRHVPTRAFATKSHRCWNVTPGRKTSSNPPLSTSPPKPWRKHEPKR